MVEPVCLRFKMQNFKFITASEVLNRFSKDMVFQGKPDFIYFATNTQELCQVIKHCANQNIPITFCGSQTAMTGSSVAICGLTIVMERMNRILEIQKDKKTGNGFATVEPAVLLGDLKTKVLQQDLFYPPQPTSYKEAQIGSSISTNATGEDTFKYGSTRQYVEELEIITAQGEIKTLKRQKPIQKNLYKNKAGYDLTEEPIDQIIGSEGTLALITKAKLKLLKKDFLSYFIIVMPFTSFENCLKTVPQIIASNLQPRCLELIGPGAIQYFQDCPDCPSELKNQNAFLYVKVEYKNENHKI